jgi:hypothetical protein
MCDFHLRHSHGWRKCFMQKVLHVNCQVEHELSWLFHCFNSKRIHLNCKLVKFCSNSCLKKSSNHYNQLFCFLSSPWNIFLAYPYELVSNSTYVPFPSPAPNYELHVLCFLFIISLCTMPGSNILTYCRWPPIEKFMSHDKETCWRYVLCSMYHLFSHVLKTLNFAVYLSQ